MHRGEVDGVGGAGEREERWPLGSGRRIVHALLLVLVFEALHFAGMGMMSGALGLGWDDLWSGRPAAIASCAATGLAAFLAVICWGTVVLGRVPWPP
jgi:hypothetical protein